MAVLASGSQDNETGAIVYYAALHAERTRHELFEKEQFPADSPACRRANSTESPSPSLRDADPDIGARLEVFAAGSCVWLPFEHVGFRRHGRSARLRDTLWAPALVQAAPSFRGMDLGEVLIPAIYPFSWKRPDEEVWLGRTTEWLADDQGRESPTGQKTLLVDGEEFPFLEVRSLKFFHAADESTEQ